MRKNYREKQVTPFDTGIRNFTHLANFFMYYAPEIDSERSMGKLNPAISEKIMKEMLNSADISKKAWFLGSFQKETLKIRNLNIAALDFEEKCCLCLKSKKETELHSLLRHIRNSLAHGHIYVWKRKGKDNGDILLDKACKNEKGNYKETISAVIIISSEIMEKWKAILENQIVIGE